MNRLKIILGYILGFIAAIILSSLTILLIFKYTILDNNYTIHILEKNNYYENISKEIEEKMENYMVSSGLPETILKDLYSEKEIKSDINIFVQNAYKGLQTETDIENIKLRLNENIDTYITDHNVKITSQSYIDSFVDNMADFYKQEIDLYGMLNGYIKYIPNINNGVNITLIILLIVFAELMFILSLLKVRFKSSVIGSGGLIILFINLIFNEKIDYQNILIISNNFSNIIKMLIKDISSFMLSSALLLIIISTILNIVESFIKAKSK